MLSAYCDKLYECTNRKHKHTGFLFGNKFKKEDKVIVFLNNRLLFQARSHNEANEAVASPKISKKNLPQMKNS